MGYEAWRITYQDSEQAARAAYRKVEELYRENERLRALLLGCDRESDEADYEARNAELHRLARTVGK